MTTNVSVLSTLMKSRIVNDMERHSFVTKKRVGYTLETLRLTNKFFN